MNTEANPYAAPVANTAANDQSIVAAAEAPFFAVSVTKLVVLSIASFNLYSVYWFYQNWARVRRTTGQDVWPVARAIFSVFFTHQLFRKVRIAAQENDVETLGDHEGRATLYVIVAVVGNIISRFSALLGLLGLFLVVPLAQEQEEINRVLAKVAPDADRNDRFTVGNYVFIVLALGFWGLAAIGLAAGTH